jgi:hypothetical protein
MESQPTINPQVHHVPMESQPTINPRVHHVPMESLPTIVPNNAPKFVPTCSKIPLERQSLALNSSFLSTLIMAWQLIVGFLPSHNDSGKGLPPVPHNTF